MKTVTVISRAGFWLAIILVGIVSLVPASQIVDTGMWDKAGHAAAYGLLSTLGLSAYPSQPARFKTMAGLFAYGMAVEFLQSYVPGRMSSVGDIAANLVGILCGFLLIHSFQIMRSRRVH